MPLMAIRKSILEDSEQREVLKTRFEERKVPMLTVCLEIDHNNVLKCGHSFLPSGIFIYDYDQTDKIPESVWKEAIKNLARSEDPAKIIYFDSLERGLYQIETM